MGEFFRVWKIAKRAYGLERVVHIDFREAYIKIYKDGSVIVRVSAEEPQAEDIERMYIQAALRLADWMKMR